MYSLICFLNYVKMQVTEDIPFTKKISVHEKGCHDLQLKFIVLDLRTVSYFAFKNSILFDFFKMRYHFFKHKANEMCLKDFSCYAFLSSESCHQLYRATSKEDKI